MYIKFLCLLACLFLFPTIIFAQLERGTTILGGTGNLLYVTRSNAFQASLNPTYTHFFSDKFSLTVAPGLRYLNQNLDNFSLNFKEVSLGLEGRYYFAGINKFKFFAGLSGFYKNFNLSSKIQFSSGNPTTTVDNTSENNLVAGISVGADYFLNKEFALELTAAYHRPITNSYNGNYTGSGDITYPSNSDIRLSTVYFLNAALLWNSDSSHSFVQGGRQSIAGSLTLSTHYSTLYAKSFDFIPGMKVKYAAFLKNKWFVSADLFVTHGILTEIKTRYYVPIFNNFYLYPEASVNIYNVGTVDNKFDGNFNLKLGASYFLSRQVALEATIGQHDLGSNSSPTFLGLINMELRYFFK